MIFHEKPCSKPLWRAKQNSQEIPPAICGNRHAIGHAVAKYVWIAGYVCESRSHQYRGSRVIVIGDEPCPSSAQAQVDVLGAKTQYSISRTAL